MKILIDADACPVVDIAITLCAKHQTECILICDTAHRMERRGAQTIVIDKGADSADFALVNRASRGDIVITQDYGLASMCLAKGARVLHQDGWEYTACNIDALLLQRHESRKFRASGGRVKGPKNAPTHRIKPFLPRLRSCSMGRHAAAPWKKPSVLP